MASSVPIVDILDDDNSLAVAAPPSCKRSVGSSGTSSRDFLDAFSPTPPQQKRPLPAEGPITLDDLLVASPRSCKRSVGSSGTSSRDFLDAFSPSPPQQKRPLLEAEGPIDLDETPSPPKRRRSSVSINLDGTPSPPKPRLSSVSINLDGTPSPPKPRLSSVSIDLDDTPSPPKPRLSSVPKLPVVVDDDVAPSPPVPSLPTGPSHRQGHVEAKQKRQQAGKKLTKEEKDKLMLERKQKREEDKLLKQASKDKLAKKKKMEKAIEKWESGKFALECITAEIDNSVIQRGSIGGPLLSSLTENGLSYEPTKNKISGSILWKLNVPDDIAQAFSDLKDSSDMNQNQVKYVAIVLEAEEFCNLVSNGLFFDHVQRVRDGYPGFTVCYIINKLMNYVNKCEQIQYKNPSNTWRRPPVEEVLCKLATHYINVHSRQCIDEAEVVEHLVGLSSSLAKCKFRKQLTWLSVHANGAIIPKNFVHKDLAKKNNWIKALAAIPDIKPGHALAISKKYPCMRSLLNEYMDASKTVSEKERLLSDLKSEDRLGDERRRLGDKRSRRVYRMLMAQNGDLDTDDPEAGGA